MKKIIKFLLLVFIILSGCTSENQVEHSAVTKNSCNLANLNAKGKIIFYNNKSGLFFYDMQDRKNYIIPGTLEAWTPFVTSSPDHTKVAFFDIRSENGGVVSTDGTIRDIKIKDKINGIFYGWQDNNNLIFVDRSHFDGSIITFNTHNRQVTNISTNLNDLYSLGPNHWYAGGDQPSAIFDSKLSRLIYVSGEIPGESLGSFGFIMRDYSNQNILWSKLSEDVGTMPKWSPDGEYAAIMTTDEITGIEKIYIINSDGEETKEIKTDSYVTLLEWSPDGKKLGYAFYDDEYKLTVYDFELDNIQQFIISQETAHIIWSPDSRQIATDGSIVDLSMNCVINLDILNQSESEPLAWLVSAP